MKEPALSRRKKPAVAVANANAAVNGASRKVKLVCSFNGAFQRRPPSGKLRYIGGETRIISVDRTIGFAKLRSKISDLRPRARSFSVKYQLPEARNGGWDAPLVLIASDDDVRCMIEEHEKMELCGKQWRLWLYVCSEEFVSIRRDRDLNVNCVESDQLGRKINGDGVQIGGKLGKISGNRVMCEDDSLRKEMLKQQVFIKQPSQNVHFGSCLRDNETEMESSCYGENQKYDHPLIDLAPEPHVPVSLNLNLENLFGSNMLDCKMTSTHLPRSDHFDNLVQYGAPQLHPLNPRDGNLLVEANRYSQCSPGLSGQVLCHGDVIDAVSLGKSVRIMQAPQQSCSARMNSHYHGHFAKNNLRNIEEGTMSIMNRENVPWTTSSASVKTGQVPISCIGQLVQIAYPLNSNTGRGLWGSSRSGISNHQFGGNDARNQQVHSCHLRSHQNSLTEINNHQAVRLDGRPFVGKCCPGLRPKSSISKPGQSGRSCHHPLKIWTGFNNPIFEERTSVVKPINEDRREPGVPSVLLDENPNPEACHLAYETCAGVPKKPLVFHDDVEDVSSCMGTMDAQVDLLMGFDGEVPDKTIHESIRGLPISCEPVNNDLEKERLLMKPQKVINNSGVSNNSVYGSAAKSGCGDTVLDAETCIISFGNYNSDIHTLNDRLESSVGISLCDLSLSSSKKVETIPGPVVDKSNGVACIPSSYIADILDNDHLHEKDSSSLSHDGRADIKECQNCLEVTVETGTSGNLSDFYTRLVTTELQIIKNSDLEHVKELGSGTYGTVFHGKWKGSDVAIKRIKPSCLTEGGVEEDRLVADFWREAHILGQLQHPNIVALYGVVTDGPVVNFATVTEYMVNGSLKQVLRRKDRTIDRRKRLKIAMDAAFGMEYLHEKNIVHFDLKSHNFLVNIRDPLRPVCKIGDMGLSKIKHKTLISGGVRGTIPWMAPELLNSENNLVTEKVDVYSFGIVMWELLTGEEPYGNMRPEEIIAGIIKGNLRPEIPNWCEPAWRSLMKRCWSSDPNSRPSFSDIAKELRAMSTSMNIN